MDNNRLSILNYLKQLFDKDLVPGLVDAFFVWENGHEFLEYSIDDGEYTLITYRHNINKWAGGKPEQDKQRHYESQGMKQEEIVKLRSHAYNEAGITFLDAYGEFLEYYVYAKPTPLVFISH
ncbi:MAG: hypothetical protein RIQ47_748, partial [Bacteroidota bacterium]